MANIVMCDICGKQEASRIFKVKKREAGIIHRWSDWKQIDICGECGKKLLGLPFKDSNGFHNPPPRRNIEEAVIIPHGDGGAPVPEYKIPVPDQKENEDQENG